VTVHSARLGAGVVTGAAVVTAYTVPAGKRTILKGVTAFNTNAAVNNLYIELFVGGALVAVWRVRCAATGNDGDSKSELPWIVLNVGDQIKVDCNAASMYYILSGAELDL
jgi:hypothetical protein